MVHHLGGSCRRPTTAAAAGAPSNAGDGENLTQWYCSRPACIGVVKVGFVVPLCLMRSLKSLGAASLVSTSICFAFIVVLVGKLVMEVAKGGELPPLRWGGASCPQVDPR